MGLLKKFGKIGKNEEFRPPRVASMVADLCTVLKALRMLICNTAHFPLYELDEIIASSDNATCSHMAVPARPVCTGSRLCIRSLVWVGGQAGPPLPPGGFKKKPALHSKSGTLQKHSRVGTRPASESAYFKVQKDRSSGETQSFCHILKVLTGKNGK